MGRALVGLLFLAGCLDLHSLNADRTNFVVASSPLSQGAAALVAGDFNRDGHIDLAVCFQGGTTPTPQRIDILLNDGAGHFAPEQSITTTSTNCVALASADFNRDHNLDLVALSPDSNAWNILIGNGNGQFSLGPSGAAGAAGSTPSQLAVGDFNGDHFVDDLAITGAPPTGQTQAIGIYVNDGTGALQAAAPIACTLGATCGKSYVWMLAVDFNLDGLTDLAAGTNNWNLLVWIEQPAGSFNLRQHTALGGDPRVAVAAPFNQNPFPDLLVVNKYIRSYLILKALGNGQFTPGAAVAVPGSGALSSAVAGDFLRRGKIDLALTDDFSNSAAVFVGNGDGSFVAPLAFAVEQNPHDALVADFNGDGKLDLAVLDQDANQNGFLTVLFNTR